VIRRLTVTVTLAALVACGSVFSYLRLLTKLVHFIVGTAYELSVGKQTPCVADIRQRFGNSLQLDGCLGSECSYTVTLSNRILAALHIVPYTELQSYFPTSPFVSSGDVASHGWTTIYTQPLQKSICTLLTMRWRRFTVVV
jgi:hypothetical protein